MSEDELLQELAILLFQADRLTLAQASRLARMPQLQFQRLLGRRQILPHYEGTDFEADLETLRSLGRL
jgi:predicted HTH domain antitoxin